MCDLAKKQCVPCMGGVPPLEGREIKKLLDQLGRGWTTVDDHHLEKEYKFDDFRQALVHEPGGGARGRAGTPPGCPPRVGQGQARALDPQDRRTYGERFHLRGQSGRALLERAGIAKGGGVGTAPPLLCLRTRSAVAGKRAASPR